MGSNVMLAYFLYGAVLEKLTDSQLVKKFPTFYGTEKFVTVFTSTHHLTQIKPVHLHPTSEDPF